MPGRNGGERQEDDNRFDYPDDLRLTNECRYRSVSARDEPLHPEYARCCRGDSWLLREDEPLCLSLGSEDEVYRFVWQSSFDGDASVSIGWQGDEIGVRWTYSPSLFGPQEKSRPGQTLSSAERARFLDALAAARFWTCGAVQKLMGTDGAQWLIEGRRGDEYRRWSLWSPRDPFELLGCVFFELAGPPLSEIRP